MNILLKRLILILLASVLAAVSNYFIFGWYNIIPWALAALLIGFLTRSQKESLILGAFFGYFLFFVYIILGYCGKTDLQSFVKFIAFDILFSLLGSLAGVIGAFIGNFGRRFFFKADT